MQYIQDAINLSISRLKKGFFEQSNNEVSRLINDQTKDHRLR